MALKRLKISDGRHVLHDSAVGGSTVLTSDAMSGPCTIHYLRFFNSVTGTDAYLKLYDDLSPTLGVTAPVEIIRNQSAAIDGGVVVSSFEVPRGLKFKKGMSYAVVSEAGTGGTTAMSSSASVAFECTEGAS